MSQQPIETGRAAGAMPDALHAERRSNWSFFEAISGQWTWWVERPDGSSGASTANFGTLKECIANAQRYGYVLQPAQRERRAEPTRWPVAMISQELWCPKCRHLRQLTRDEFVSRGDAVRCAKCEAAFVASPQNVTCCIEDGEGLREVPLPS